MQAFFNRAILCEYNTLFIISASHAFSELQIKYMINLINELLTYKNNNFNKKNFGKKVEISDTHWYMDSCLVFIYYEESSILLNELEKFNAMIFQMTNPNLFGIINQKLDPLREKLYLNTYIIQSEICGLGKSTKKKK